ncbi:uncharacterized protein LOC127831824 [Dreissena polymorpha]|uniref:LRRCT domain-containing protein n=1 Tax=Dreissena polymorpha TaxID=45954 RepID=A0A9D4GZQ0_DREPO|nr:uncharacterized protein LOC127831824 [Dreissena polymorpha]KAH3824369.1 hypothetical protein DPMN_126204 [Dreissena polymorpha]
MKSKRLHKSEGYVFVIFMCCVLQTILTAPLPDLHGLSNCDLYITADNTTQELKCSIQTGQVLDYRRVRGWTALQSTGTFSVHITCNGGSLHMPWPFKAKHVVALQVNGCKLFGFLSEMTQQQSVEDELRTLMLYKTTIVIPFADMYALRNNLDRIPRDTDCGQVTLEKLVLRDVHYDLQMTPEDRDRMSPIVHNTSIGHDAALLPTKSPCVFPNLKYVDESGSRKTGQYHLKLLPDYSVFPKLEVYNMSRNELSHIPDFFRYLHSDKYPSLRQLDFSNNILHSFEFEIPKNVKTCTLEKVDLHNNRIAFIPKETTDTLQNIGTILVDLRENPLRCTCELKDLRVYLEAQYRKSANMTRQLISEVTCSLRSAFHGTMDQVSLLNSGFDKKCG